MTDLDDQHEELRNHIRGRPVDYIVLDTDTRDGLVCQRLVDLSAVVDVLP